MGRRRLALAALAIAVALSLPGGAHADGDPASDVLYTKSVFIPFNAPIPKAEVDRLQAVVAGARANGYPVKVALIGTASDLGSAYTLWGKPQQYAQFLGAELVFLYRGRLLVVMPNGYGFSRDGKPTTEASALRGLKVSPGPVGLPESAVKAVTKLASAAGHPVTAPGKPKRKGSGSSNGLVIVIVVVVAVALAGVLAVVVWLRKRTRGAQPRIDDRPTETTSVQSTDS
jgi:hypothetical protein